jgi:hypothetical protein
MPARAQLRFTGLLVAATLIFDPPNLPSYWVIL